VNGAWPGYIPAVVVFAASAIETAPLPVLADVAAVGAVIVIFRVAVLNRCRVTLSAGVGLLAGRAFVAIGGFGWLLIGLMGSCSGCSISSSRSHRRRPASPRAIAQASPAIASR
jgi:hypothetical protein